MPIQAKTLFLALLLRRDADAVVADGQVHGAGVRTELDLDLAGLGVAHDIAERFLHDAEQHDLDLAGDGGKQRLVAYQQAAGDAALSRRRSPTCHSMAACKPRVQRHRTQFVHDAAHALDGGVDIAEHGRPGGAGADASLPCAR